MPGGVSVLSVSPADGEAGVGPDAKVTITFSAAMNQASVESAWQSTDLPASAVTFAWNEAGDTVTVTPTDSLELAEGTDPAMVSARAYSFEVSGSAMSAEGGTLGTPLQVTFTTARRIRGSLEAVAILTRSMRSDGVVFSEGAVTMAIGDSTGNLQVKTFVTFELPTLPAGATLEAATLTGHQNSTAGNPYALGALQALHTSVRTIDASAFTANPIASLGDFSTTAEAGYREIDVTARLADDLANRQARGERTQYRLEFPTPTSANATADEARFSRSLFDVTFSYLLE